MTIRARQYIRWRKPAGCHLGVEGTRRSAVLKQRLQNTREPGTRLDPSCPAHHDAQGSWLLSKDSLVSDMQASSPALSGSGSKCGRSATQTRPVMFCFLWKDGELSCTRTQRA